MKVGEQFHFIDSFIGSWWAINIEILTAVCRSFAYFIPLRVGNSAGQENVTTVK